MKPYRVQALVADADLAEPMCYDATGDFYVRPHAEGSSPATGPRNARPIRTATTATRTRRFRPT